MTIRTALLLVLLGGAVLVGCNEASTSVKDIEEADVFKSNLSVGMTRLRAQYSKLEPKSVERGAACGSLIFDLLGMCEDDEQNQALADAFAAVIARSDSFNMYDYNVLWLAGELLKDYPPEDPTFLVMLGRKVESARSEGTPKPYKTTYSSLAVGFILNRVSYTGQVWTFNDRVDYEEWESLHTWLEANADKLKFDPEIEMYHPVEPPEEPEEPEPAEDAESPTDPESPDQPESSEEPELSDQPDEIVIEIE